MNDLRLKTHPITLSGERVTLRPMTEADWPHLLVWNSDPDVLYYSEGDDVPSYSLEEVQGIYCMISQTALCFIIEYQGTPIGDCWLQRMNLERMLQAHPGFDVRRIDLEIGKKLLWGQGLGTEVIRLLTDFAFQQEGADYVFGVDIADYNIRSRRAFEKNGYELVARHPQPQGMKARYTVDLLAMNPRLRA
ncbi:MAG: GNAT family N-acetyltransferase [Anaerolineaceae bacterium]|nr:GNAT family N-acetyltransferase [Anaerolineaceae bacterium]